MKCFECGGEVIATTGAVRMNRQDGSLIIFTEVPLSQCQQCGEQYISGHWAARLGELLHRGDELVTQEEVAVPVVTVRGG
jgi:YgiT-type zinc finger domain-containing protein